MSEAVDAGERVRRREEQIREDERKRIVQLIRNYRNLTIEGLGYLVWSERLAEEIENASKK